MCVYVRLGSYKCVFARSHRRAARSAPGPGSSLSSSHYTFLFSFFFESVVFVALVCSRLALPLNDRAMTMTMLRFTCLIIIDSGGPPETIGHTAVIVPRLRHRQLEKWDLLEISLRWWCDGRRWLAGSHSTGNAIQSTDAVTFWSVGLVGCECYGSSPRCLLVVIAGILICCIRKWFDWIFHTTWPMWEFWWECMIELPNGQVFHRITRSVIGQDVDYIQWMSNHRTLALRVVESWVIGSFHGESSRKNLPSTWYTIKLPKITYTFWSTTTSNLAYSMNSSTYRLPLTV